MKILITGHRGFIGSHLTKSITEYRGFDLLDGDDIRNKQTCAKKLEGIDVVVHMASKTGVGGGELDPYSYIQTNVIGTSNLLKKGIKHFIYFSSASIYGNQTPPNSEVTIPNPKSVYGATKLSAEWLVRNSGIPYTIVRPFNVYGEYGRKDQVLYKWMAQMKEGKPITIRGDGTSKRGYTYVNDLVLAILAIIKKGAHNETYNLGAEKPISLNEVADLFACEREYIPMPGNEIYEGWSDSSKARKELGFAPDTDFKIKAKQIICQ